VTRSAYVNLVVPDFSLKAGPTALGTTPGGSAVSTITIGSLYGFSGDVSLSLSGLNAAQGSWTFTPPLVAGGAGTSRLQIATAGALAPGTYPMTVTATGGGISHTVALKLTVSPPPDFSLAVSPASTAVTAGLSGTYQVTVGSIGGFRSAVSLSAAGLPAGATATFSPGAPTAPATSTLTVRTLGTTPRGTFALRIAGRSGALAHEVTAGLTVR
jgi:hypothetical protein